MTRWTSDFGCCAAPFALSNDSIHTLYKLQELNFHLILGIRSSDWRMTGGWYGFVEVDVSPNQSLKQRDCECISRCNQWQRNRLGDFHLRRWYKWSQSSIYGKWGFGRVGGRVFRWKVSICSNDDSEDNDDQKLCRIQYAFAKVIDRNVCFVSSVIPLTPYNLSSWSEPTSQIRPN